jgi:hypothetical protein
MHYARLPVHFNTFIYTKQHVEQGSHRIRGKSVQVLWLDSGNQEKKL